jgi:Macrocin-O-methyltransferase (TylF)
VDAEHRTAAADGPPPQRGWLHPIVRQRAKLDIFFMKQFRANSLATWFLRALRSQHHRRRLGPHGTYYEFGVGRGRTMARYLRALKLYCVVADLDLYSYRIFAFDSFEGLPPKQSPRDDFPLWRPGLFRGTQEEARARIARQINLGRGTVRFIKGFFEQSLTPALAAELQNFPPAIVTIDVDYYSSTKTVLEWLTPFTPSGCLFYFDDIWGFYGHPEMGELAAINEFNRAGAGFLTPYTELGTTVGGKSYIFARKEYEHRSAST